MSKGNVLQRAAELGRSRPTSAAYIVSPRGIDCKSISIPYWHHFRQFIFKTSTCVNESQCPPPPERKIESVILWMPKTAICQL